MDPVLSGRAGRPRRTGRVVSAVVSAVAVAVAAPLIAAPAAFGQGHGRGSDHLTVVVRHAGAGRDGTYELFCHPGGGRHPDVEGACRGLDAQTRWGRDLFAPVPPGSVCSMISGGPATARVTGTWAGRPVDASYDRNDGCEIARWDRMVPLLPKIG
ncbi:hypothetical protein Shyhy01_27120 [Streptomyces hygroscopicus subsp. hygroscopicus]|uniref:SSI family serine proteinase inhibitor n=1 Tax=Streptomyces sp. KHY 26 TaxID=3097359 RepID=UPI0024A3AA78|nr:SSI family serine proteinase inhibitor [Streptomyces hygroscopicus]GLX49762.1 hypothetical protein Shyhy01_27120 [Streptomyces hygroscopicus subsp. hygroscopicus]